MAVPLILKKSAKKKVLIVENYGEEYTQMFTQKGWALTDLIYDADLIQFTGGSDVTPALYGDAAHPKTICNPDRDFKEQLIFLSGLKQGVPMAGICRGGQFLNVMNGGSMWQDVNNHCGEHEAIYTDLKKQYKIRVSSTHHQMMIPVNNKKEVLILMLSKDLCTQREKCATIKSGSGVQIKVDNVNTDIEALYYKKTNCLCFQPHPEFKNYISLVNLYFEYLEKLLLV